MSQNKEQDINLIVQTYKDLLEWSVGRYTNIELLKKVLNGDTIFSMLTTKETAESLNFKQAFQQLGDLAELLSLETIEKEELHKRIKEVIKNYIDHVKRIIEKQEKERQQAYDIGEQKRMDPMIAVEVIKTAGSLAGILSFVRSWLQSGKTEVTPQEREKVLVVASNNSLTATPSPDLVIILSRIAEGYLNPIVDRLRSVDQDYRVIIQTGTMLEIKQAHNHSASQVCSLLKLIKRHNSGQLPSDNYFQELWDNFSCEKVPTVFD